MCKSIEQSSLVRERCGKSTRYAGIAAALGLIGALSAGCDSDTPTTATSAGGTSAADSATGTGGSSQTKKTATSSNRGGAASTSTTKTKTTNTGGSRSEGGASSEEGGAASSEEGGAANGGASSERTSSARAKGGATSKASTTTKAPAAGGSSPSSNAGGATGTKTTGAQGGASAVGGATAVGGNTSTSTPTGTCTPSTKKFSFFVTSQKRLFALAKAFNGSDKGFGGDLRYGETGDDAGLKGADKICRQIAEQAQPGNCKTWRAFLSTSKVNAIDRIGKGPWYDAFGNLFGNSPTEIISDIRPPSAHASIKNDFPNEDGVPNHDALQTGNTQNQDNHDFLTGTGEDGKLYQGSTNTNCKDWTSQDKTIRPRVGHSWPRAGMGAMSKTDSTSTTTPGGGFTMPGSGATMATMNSWVSSLDENGCAPGVNLSESSIPQGSDQGGDGTVGGGGGYGGIYCFAEEP